MNTGTKFWLAVGVAAAMVAIIVIYILRTAAPDFGIMGLLVGVVTLVVGGYFKANVDASDQAARMALAGVQQKTITEIQGKLVDGRTVPDEPAVPQ